MDISVTSGKRMDTCSCRRSRVLALICLTLFTFINPTYQQVTLEIEPQNSPASTGETYTLTCRITGSLSGIGHAYWKKWSNETEPPAYQRVTSYNYNTRDKGWGDQVNQGNVGAEWVSSSTSMAEYLLTFKSIECKNEGRYQCVVSLHEPISAVTEIKVVVDPDHPTLYINNTIDITDSELILSDGQPATLMCSGVTGYPEGQLSWFYKKDISARKHIETKMINRRIKTGGCEYEGSTHVNFTMTKEINGSKYWCYAYQRTDRFIMDSVTTKSFVLVKFPPIKPAVGATCYEKGTCATSSSFGVSPAVFVGVFIITALHHATCIT